LNYIQVFPWGNDIYHIYYDNDKKFIDKVPDFQMTLAVETDEQSDWHTLFGKPVKLKQFGIKNAKKFYQENIELYPIYDYINPEYQFIAQYYPDEIQYNINDFRVWFYDIEVYQEKGFAKPEDPYGEIVAITIWDTKSKCFYLLTSKPFDTINIEEHIKHIQAKNEKGLLKAYIKLIHKLKPDFIIGYFSETYDDPYVINRMKRVLGEEFTKNNLSYLKLPIYEKERMNENNKKVQEFFIPGITLIDYVQLIKKYLGYNLESYSLNYVAGKFLKSAKVDYEKYDNINEFYKQNPQKFFEYNIQDVRLLKQLDEYFGFLNLLITLSYLTKVNFKDMLGTLVPWDVYVYNYLQKRQIVIPPNKKAERQSYAGAYVKQPEPGIYHWVITQDLNSLYPHLIMQFNISPETLIPQQYVDVNWSEIDDKLLYQKIEPPKDCILAGNGYCFRKDKIGFASKIMSYLYEKRKKLKQQMLEKEKVVEEAKKQGKHEQVIQQLINEFQKLKLKQLALKVLLNSFYGAYAHPYFRYFDIRLATAITLSGQWVIRYMENYIESVFKAKGYKGNKVIYCDTDSIALNMSEYVEKHCYSMTDEQIVKQLETFSFNILQPKVIDVGYKKLAKYVNANENKMKMKLEKIAKYGIYKAKKKYALLTLYEEGVFFNEPELKVTGIEIKRSSTPEIVKKYLEEALILLMKQPEQLKAKIKQWYDDFMKQPYTEIAFPRGATDIEKYTQPEGFKPGTPIHIRGCIVYNRLIDKYDLPLPKLENGAKIKFLYLKEPNPIQSYVISFSNKLPLPELEQYIDKQTMWKKAFYNVIEDLVKSINREDLLSKQNNLKSLF